MSFVLLSRARGSAEFGSYGADDRLPIVFISSPVTSPISVPTNRLAALSFSTGPDLPLSPIEDQIRLLKVVDNMLIEL